MNSRLAWIYGIVADGPSSITLGRGVVQSPFERFMAAALLHLGWRSPVAQSAPKQARLAYDAMKDAAARRLDPMWDEENDNVPIVESERDLKDGNT
jgi:hypothetical protein